MGKVTLLASGFIFRGVRFIDIGSEGGERGAAR
jgi:hypothetical protein